MALTTVFFFIFEAKLLKIGYIFNVQSIFYHWLFLYVIFFRAAYEYRVENVYHILKPSRILCYFLLFQRIESNRIGLSILTS